ncbi:MAG: DUF1294 domain-containing protein [Vibrionaceae bacterium]|nr:DUF1294 domain-containing protein [Vibrionaceae bacterium]
MKGQIVEWNDSKGYGFISASNGERNVFMHVSSVNKSRRRPKLNDMVTFEVSKDSKGRFNAENVVIQGVDSFPVTVLFSFTFLVAAFSSVVVFDGVLLLIPLYLALSVFTYLMFAWDKQAAQNGNWRTPEKTLHLLSLAGGWPGALLAQFQLRHKSQKQPFKFILWIAVALNICAFTWSLTDLGREIIQNVVGSL